MELKAFIIESMDSLVSDWVSFARTLPACQHLSLEELQDHAAAMLAAIVADLDVGQTALEQFAKSEGRGRRRTAGETRAEAHGSQRFALGFGLNELVAEFRALRATVLRQWTASGSPEAAGLSAPLVRFNEGIDQAIAESLARFVNDLRLSDEESLCRREAEARRLQALESHSRRAEERLNAALNEAQMACWEWNPQTDQLTSSQNLTALLGLTPGQNLSRAGQGRALLHPEDRASHEALVADAIRRHAPWHAQFRIVRPCDQQVGWFEERAMPVSDEQGSLLFTGLVWDITEFKTAEAAMKRNELALADLLEHAPFGVYVVDSQLRITQMNLNARRQLFRNAQPAIGSDLQTILRIVWPEPVAAESVAAFRHTLDTGEPYQAPRFVSRRSDIDAVQSYEWELHRVVLANGQYGVVCYYFDSTPMRDAEQALREADQRKDQFLATLAHELRNPLAPIRQAATIARLEGTPPDRVRWSLDIIDRQAGKMALLLDDLLDVSRITRGRLDLQRRPIDLAEVVGSALETVTPLVDARQHEVHLTLPDTPLRLQADPLRLSQVISNLLTNASRYSSPGSPIEVAVRRDSEFASITVSDHGIGIAQDQLEAVFEMFGQGEAPAALKEGGLGVGLALARGLVELHGGTLVAHSEGAGHGAQFVVRLPLAPEGIEVARANTPEPADREQAARVLVIDDNVDAADSLALLLRVRGHVVCAAYSGAEGLACASTFRPSLVLLDLGMPGMDGYEVARRLRAMEGGAAFTLVAVSGWGQAADRWRTVAAGIDYHLTKPLQETQLQPAFSEARRRATASGSHPS